MKLMHPRCTWKVSLASGLVINDAHKLLIPRVHVLARTRPHLQYTRAPQRLTQRG